MWRSFFIAAGIFLCLLGGEFLACDHLVLRPRVKEQPPTEQTFYNASYNAPVAPPKRIYVPKDWMPWTLMASGAIVLIYSVRPRS